MNYLKCDNCLFQNKIFNERLVFCLNCKKKIKNNYTDWAKERTLNSLDEFIKNETTQTEISNTNNPKIYRKK